MSAAPRRPLDGVVVLDFTWALAGPFMTSWLCAAGATVVKVENVERPDLQRVVEQRYGRSAGGSINDSPGFHEVNGGKRSISLDLKRPGAVEVVKNLAARSHLVVESFRPGVLGRLGLGSDVLWEINPHLVVVSICSWRPGTEEGGFAGYAPIFSAFGGLAHVTRAAGGPPSPVRVPMDILTGTNAGVAALAGLIAQCRGDRGRHLSVSGVESATTVVADVMAEAQYGVSSARSGNGEDEPGTHGCFRAADGGWVAVAADDEASRSAAAALVGNHGDLTAALAAWVANRPAESAERELAASGVAAAVSQTLDDLAGDPHHRARGFFTPVERPYGGHQLVAGMPWTVAGERLPIGPSPMLGEHTREVLTELCGYPDGEIERLQAEGAFGAVDVFTDPRQNRDAHISA